MTILTAARITGAESDTVTELKFKVRELDKQLEAAEFNVKIDEELVTREAERIEKIGRELAEQSEDSRLESAAAELLEDSKRKMIDAIQPYDPDAKVSQLDAG